MARFLNDCLRNFSLEKFISPKNLSILITGCDSGFGLSTAKRLHKFGFNVYAGCLDVNSDGAKYLRDQFIERMHVIKLDVTSENDIERTINLIKQNSIPLWALINNAGIFEWAPVEAGKDISVYRRVLEVNLFGAIALTRKCLPLLRHTNGRVINISSVAAHLTWFACTAYSISKHAIDAFTNGLRREMSLFNVKVIKIEPAMFKTNIYNGVENRVKQLWLESDEQVKKVYGENYDNKLLQMLNEFYFTEHNSIETVINSIEHAICSIKPYSVYQPSGILQKFFIAIITQMPIDLQDFLLRRDVFNSLQFYNFLWKFRDEKNC